MRITFKLFATLTDYLPAGAIKNQIDLSIDESATIASVVDQFHLPPHLVHLVLVNGVFVPPGVRAGRRLREGDVLAVWPPIAGG